MSSTAKSYDEFTKREKEMRHETEDNYEWVAKLRQDLNLPDVDGGGKPRGWEKLKLKVVENPFVPLGVIATSAAVVNGLRAMLRGDKRMSQLMMRARVGCQAFAVAAIVIGFEIERRHAIAKNEEQNNSQQPQG